MGKSVDIGNVNIEWLGHDSFKIKSGNLVLYTDPFKISEGEKADLILITHDHYDHCDPDSMEAIGKEGTIIITTQAVASKLEGKILHENIRILKEGESIKENGVEVKAVPAYNIGKPYHAKGSGVGFIFKIGDQRIYLAGDTDRIPEMVGLGEIDIALLPIGGTFTMNEQEAAQAVDEIKPKIAIPMHYGTLDQTEGDPKKFKELSPLGNVEVKILG